MVCKIYTLASDTYLNLWLNTLGYTTHILPEAYLPHEPLAKEHPQDFLYRTASEKIKVLTSKAPIDSLLMTTVKIVTCGQRILRMPQTLEEARYMMCLLSGRRHQILTLISLKYHDTVKHRKVLTRVSFKRLSHQEIENYLQAETWRGHVGGYDVLGRAASFIKSMNGAMGGIWGVPIYDLSSLLGGLQSESKR